MNTPQASLTKTCAVCGLQKPLSAFLQLAGSKGTTIYGNICASCRKTQSEKIALPQEPDDVTTSTSGKKIDTKAKVAGDIDRKQQWETTEEAYHAEREKEQKETKKETSKKETANYEKKKQESFLKSRTFITTDRKKATVRSDAKQPIEQTLQTAQNREQVERLVQVTKEEQQKADISLDVPFLDTQIAGKLKHSGVAFKALINLLGKSSALGRAASEMAHKAEKNSKTAGDQRPAAEQTPEDYIKEHWSSKPKSRR